MKLRESLDLASGRLEWIIFILYGIWLLIVLLSGAGINLIGVDWSFARVGELGDAFGSINALMATLVAVFAVRAFRHEKANSDRLFLASRLAENEGTFFRLLELRNAVIDDLQLPRTEATGVAVLNHLYTLMVKNSKGLTKEQQEAGYKALERTYVAQLAHYMRLTYHIIRFVVINFPQEKRYFYLQLLRAQQSNSELALIGLNCAHGGGRLQFKVWVEEFHLLHNLSKEDKEYFHFDELYAESAFMRSP